MEDTNIQAEVKDQKPIERPGADKLLEKFLEENGLELIFGDFSIRKVSDGGLLFEKPSIIVVYKDQLK